MSAHKAHHYAAVEVPGGPEIMVFFRWRWQAWLMFQLLKLAIGAQRGGA